MFRTAAAHREPKFKRFSTSTHAPYVVADERAGAGRPTTGGI